MKKLMIILVMVFAVATVGFAAPLSPYNLFGVNSPSDLSLSMILYFGQYEPTNFSYRRVIDSLSPTCYSGNLHDTILLKNGAWGIHSVDSYGWTMMAWIRFDNRVTSNSEINHIPLITSTNSFKYFLSKNGSQLLFQIITGFGDSADPDNVYPYSFKSDSFQCVFDNYFHLLSLSYNRSTGIFSAYVDGNLVSKKPAAEGIDTIKSFAGSGLYYVGSYPMGTYSVPAGSFFAGTEVICKTISDAAHKRYYDTTIAHAPKQKPSAIEKTSLAIAKTHLLSVSPNPATANMIISFTYYGKTTINLYQANGQLIKTLFSGVANGRNTITLCNSLKSGIYIIELSSKTHKEITKSTIIK